MTDRLTALKELLAKVEAGEIEGYAFEFADISGAYAQHAVQAYHGSLDAALALHEAVLPGWDFAVYADSAEVSETKPGDGYDITEHYGADSDTPARAWLIAILRALIAQEEGR